MTTLTYFLIAIPFWPMFYIVWYLFATRVDHWAVWENIDRAFCVVVAFLCAISWVGSVPILLLILLLIYPLKLALPKFEQFIDRRISND